MSLISLPTCYLYQGLTVCESEADIRGRLGGVYTAGFFRMSTWIPLSWGIINALVLILSSFAIQGGL